MRLYSLVLFCCMAAVAVSQPISPKREFRGVWIATVANIDWPRSRTAPVEQQKEELLQMLRQLKSAGTNAVFFQVRTECDALYDSPVEPWSYWLTGKQGKAPEPYYDPLQFVIAEAHKLGMELHAWFNPYRAVKTIGSYEAAPNHVSVRHPEWLLTFKDYTMLNPGIPAVRDYIGSVVRHVLASYDVDGIHFDDYFYPYSPKVSTEDSSTYAAYNSGGLDIDNWRRWNINTLMESLYAMIREAKPWVKFGISPFGIVENKYAGTEGFNSYSILYCDPLTWIKDKTVDYVNPQLYWEIGHPKADYKKLLPWWAEVSRGVHLYIGQYSSRFTGRQFSGNPAEMGDQIRMNRSLNNVHGQVFFSAKSVTVNANNFGDSLSGSLYRYPALVPVMPWKDNQAPAAPYGLHASADTGGIHLSWATEPDSLGIPCNPSYLVYRFSVNDEIDLNNPRYIIAETMPGQAEYSDVAVRGASGSYLYVVSSLDKVKNESTGVASVRVNFPF